jgi:membrane protein implicated in regulation of membrane protease activity
LFSSFLSFPGLFAVVYHHVSVRVVQSAVAAVAAVAAAVAHVVVAVVVVVLSYGVWQGRYMREQRSKMRDAREYQSNV